MSKPEKDRPCRSCGRPGYYPVHDIVGRCPYRNFSYYEPLDNLEYLEYKLKEKEHEQA